METDILCYLPRFSWSFWLLGLLFQASQLPGLAEKYANDLCLFKDKRDLVKDSMTINSILILVSLFMPRERSQQLNSQVSSKLLSQSKLLSIHIFRGILLSCSGRHFRINLILTRNILCKPNLNSPYLLSISTVKDICTEILHVTSELNHSFWAPWGQEIFTLKFSASVM